METTKVKLMEDALLHFKRVLNCENFVVTGSFALYKFGLVDEAEDLDIILINATVDAEDILFNLASAPESQHLLPKEHHEEYPDSLKLTRIMYQGIKMDFFFGDCFADRQYFTAANGLVYSTANSIFAAKRRADRFKDWLQLRQIAARIFREEELMAFINNNQRNGTTKKR